MVLMKIFAAIISTKLQRFESRANATKMYSAEGPGWRMGERKVCGSGKILHGLRGKLDADFEYDVSFDHTGS